MTSSFTTTSTVSFTITEARRLASKVVTDMARCLQIYGRRLWNKFNVTEMSSPFF
jgi:hypothetical protein